LQRKAVKAPLSDPKQWLWASLAYLFVLIFVFHQVVLHPLTQVLSLFSSDLPRLFYPIRHFALEQFQAGHYLPLWDPHTYGGAPFFGNFSSALLYPLNLLFLFLPMSLAFNAFFLLHVLLAGLSMYLWASSRRLHPLSAWLAGMLYMFCGAFFLHLYAGHLTHLATITWIPLIFLALDKIMETRKWGWVLLATTVLTLQILAGFPQYFYISTLIAGVYVLLNLWKKSGALQTLGQVVMAYAGALGLTAIQWGAGLAASHECLRGQELSYDFAGSYSLPPECLLTSVFPDLFEKFQVFRYGRSEIFWDTNLFLGTTALILVFMVLKGAPSPVRRVSLAMIGASLLLALGSYTPLFHLLYEFLPGISHLRGSSKFKLVACLFLILLAAVGLDLLLRQKPEERQKNIPWLMRTGLFLSTLCLLVSFWPDALQKLASLTGMNLAEGTWAQAQGALFLDILAANVTCFGAVLLIWLAKDPWRLGSGLCLLAGLELFSFTQTHLTYFDWRSLGTQEKAVSGYLNENPGDYRVMTNMGNRVEAAGGSNIWGCDPFLPSRYYRFMAFSQGSDEKRFQEKVGNSQAFPVVSGLFHLIRCKYAMMDLKDRLSVTQFAGKDLPRVLLMSQWEKVAGPEEILSKLADPRFPYLSKTIVEEDPGFPSSPLPSKGKVQVKDRSTDEMEITADLDEPALLVLGENYTEGWKTRAFTDSHQQSYRVIPADYILRGIPLGTGRHHFLLEYRPPAYVVGLWLSLISLALYLVVLCRWLPHQLRHKAWVRR